MKLVLLFFHCLTVVALLVQGQDQSGFISIDCGIAEEEYEDDTTKIKYLSDMKFINTGENHNISQEFKSPDVAHLSQEINSPDVINLPMRQLSSVRSFPNPTEDTPLEETRNCYTFHPSPGAKGNNYLIRAWFMYGNYDSKDQTPEFDLHLDVDEWATVKFSNASNVVIKEIIHVPRTDYIHVCLVNTGRGTPFISALEIRKLNNSIYETQFGSLATYRRVDVGSTSNQIVRYGDDVYDRIWRPYISPNLESVSAGYTWGNISSSDYKLPPSVMTTAVTPINGSTLKFLFRYDPSQKFYLYMHFADVEETQPRKFEIYFNGDRVWAGDCSCSLSQPKSIFTPNYVSGSGQLEISINSTEDSTLLPILNAMEIYMVKELPQSPTNQTDVDSIRKIKLVYKIERNWQGDPCLPRKYLWQGLQCSYDLNFPKITSLYLSSTGLFGYIDPSLASLESLSYIDLSNNSLSGPFPDFLSQLPSLKYINLSYNNLTGSVPSVFIERSKTGSLTLSTDGNPNLCSTATCETKKKKTVITRFTPLIVSLASFLILLTATLPILWNLRRRKQKQQEHIVKPNVEAELLESKNRHLTYLEVISITSDFKEVLGVGGFGRVYRGCLNDGTQVAVKMLSHPSICGSKQFRTEAQLLTKVHHKNLVSLIGYCHEGEHMGLIYEYMANGNLQGHLSEQSATLLTWEHRVQIAVDAAQALDYLHNGCKPPIVHRDIKATNILLTENLQAKVSDFGISRLMPLEDESQVSTALAGTPGYLDPEYQRTNRMNEKSDVYSFGIVLLEIITGQPPLMKIGDEITHIIDRVQPIFERAEIDKIVDSRLRNDYDNNSAWKVLDTAMCCVLRSPSQRPSMSLVVGELKECLQDPGTWRRTMQGRDSSVEIMAADLGSLAATGPSTR